MKKILWISPYAPYDRVSHAGGKIHNYYVKTFHKSGNFDITLLSLCLQSEKELLDLDKYQIKNMIFVMDRSKAKRFQRRATSAWSYVNPFDKYAGVCLTYERNAMHRMINSYKKQGNCPDIVILQWTFSLMFLPVIKRYFPNCRIVAIEEDVTFLGYWRKWTNATGIKKWFWKCRYNKMHSLEVKMLEQADLTVTNNPKDSELLVKAGINREYIFTASPYFQNYSYCKRKPEGKDILFFGAMSRAENYESALWFIKRVMPLLSEEHVRFIVLGGNPPEKLKSIYRDDVIIKGYVDDVTPYFEKSLCFVAPLLFGAGIKIKILEAMSSGIPVLTNQIGIEGILAKNGAEYFLCETAEEYAITIKKLINGEIDTKKWCENEKNFISRNYRLTVNTEVFMDKLLRS